jgi:acetamidase/formamidase
VTADIGPAASTPWPRDLQRVARTRGAGQAYAICSVAVDIKVSQLVGVPSLLVSAFLPEDILTT